MFNQLFKLGLFVTLGLWLKGRVKGLLLLLAAWFITWLVHSEYLAYVEHSGNAGFLEWSYVIKWSFYIITFLIYFSLVEWRMSRQLEAPADVLSESTINSSKNDGFDFLRKKSSLQSEADKALNSPSSRDNRPRKG